jgi:endo-1,4-beta-xylanase
VLVFKNQVPEWLRNANLPADKLRAFLRDYIRTVVGRYKGRIHSWDVVNEPLDEGGRYDETTFWASRLGPSYIADAFRWAHEADPSATLYLNEVLDVAGPMADGAAALVADLRAQGVPVGGIGLQTHVEASQSVLTEDAFQQTYERFAALGVKVAVSEMDVALDSPLAEPRQAEVFANAATACARVPACERFTIWGVSDRYSWLGAQKMGLPIDGGYRLKPGWAAIAGALAARR